MDLGERKVKLVMSLGEAMDLFCIVNSVSDDSCPGLAQWQKRMEEEFPELPYAIDPEGFLKEELQDEFMKWVASLPEERSPEMVGPPMPRDMAEYYA